MKLLFLVIFFQTNLLFLNAQKQLQNDYVRFNPSTNYVYDPMIRSALLATNGDPSAIPLFFLGELNKLILVFDDLSGDPNDYQYELIHCTAAWELSDLMKMEYIQGIGEDFINDVEYATAQYSKYTHYTLQFPAENMQPTKSGNYCIRIYKNNDKSDVVLVRRFLVLENKVLVNALVRKSNNMDASALKQEVAFTVVASAYKLSNPYEDLKVNVLQNTDWNMLQQNVKPLFVKGNEIEYLLEEGNDFWGMNEHRTLDVKSIFYQPANVAKIELKTPVQVDLYPDKKRSAKTYAYLKDLNGYSYIGNESTFDRSLNAEYVWVQFSLQSTDPVGTEVYLYGQMCNNAFSEECRLIYDSTHNLYYKNILVKQGLHSYLYVTEQLGSAQPDYSLTEGNHWQTENDYYIFVYHRGFGDLYDRLIGFKEVNSVFNE